MPPQMDASGDRASSGEMSAVAASLRDASAIFGRVRFALPHSEAATHPTGEALASGEAVG